MSSLTGANNIASTNLFWNNTGGNVVGSSGLSISNSLTGNPLFAGANDYRLTAGSPAIGTANNSYVVSPDYADANRPATSSDIGAYEHFGSVPPPASDTTKPTVSITTPANNATVSGVVTATASASDNVGITKVDFSLDGASTPAMTDTASPYNYSFDSKTLGNGSHTITAKAYDAAGNSTSSTITVTVNNPDTTPPSTPANLRATAANATTVNLTWNASTDSGTNATGVAKYNVLRNGIVIAQTTTTSYTDTSAVANTTYSYTVQAQDNAGNVSGSSATASVKTPAAATTNQDLLFNGTNMNNYLVQAAPGAITQVPDPAGTSQQVFKYVVKNTDVAPITPTENPRAQLVGPDDINIGDDVWLENKFYLPSDFPSNIPGWLAVFAT